MKTSKLSLNKQTVFKFNTNVRKKSNVVKICPITSMFDISFLKTLF